MKTSIRVINDDTTDQEMQAGHITPHADPPKNNAARGGFGNRDGKEGYGSDTAGGSTALGVNETADAMAPPPDNIRADDQGRPRAENDDLPLDDEAVAEARPAPKSAREKDITGPDEMSDPDSGIGMGQMAPRPQQPPTSTATNAELTDPDATDTAIAQ